MATYAMECDFCYNNNVVVYHTNYLYWLQTEPGWVQRAVAKAPVPALDSDLSLKPVYSTDGNRHMVLHMNANRTGNLTQIVWDGAEWTPPRTYTHVQQAVSTQAAS